MKTVLTLILCLSMTAFVGADFQLTVNGSSDYDEITVSPSETLDIGVNWKQGYLNHFDVALVLDNDLAVFAMPYWVQDTPFTGHWENFHPNPGSTYGFISPLNPIGPQFFHVGSTLSSLIFLEGPTTVFDGIKFHSETQTVILDLIVYDPEGTVVYDTNFNRVNYVAGQVLDSLMIYTPEPVSLTIFFTMGIMLLRRKKRKIRK